MSAEHRSARPSVVVATTLLVAFLVSLTPGNGAADTEPETMSPTERIVAELEESPVHVDPSFSGALPEDRVNAWVERITESEVPLRVVAVPLIEGGDWSGDASQMIAAVHDRIGGQGHYLVVDGRTVSGHDFETGTQGSSNTLAFYSGLTVSYELGYDASAVDKVERAVEIALSEDPRAIYDAAVEERERGPFDWIHSLGPGAYTMVVLLPWILAILALVGLVFGVYRWRRPRTAPTVPQHTAFDNANLARRDELAAKAGRELVELGERLSAARPLDEPGATEALHRALDAHAAARRIHDRLPTEGALVDIVGVLVLLDAAEDHMAQATVPKGRRRSVPLRSHCYANPLHGTDTKVTRWREFGGRGDVRVPLCAVCAKAVADRTRPTVLSDRYRGRDVPYYEVPAAESVWAATGFGTLREDLVARILRGDHAGRR